MLGGGTDGPASAQEVHLVVGVDPPAQVHGQMEIQEAGVGTGPQHVALFGLGQGTGFVRGQAGGAAVRRSARGMKFEFQFFSITTSTA